MSKVLSSIAWKYYFDIKTEICETVLLEHSVFFDIVCLLNRTDINENRL